MGSLHTDADTGMLRQIDQLLHIAQIAIVYNRSLWLQIAAQLEFRITVMHSAQMIVQVILCYVRVDNIIELQKADAVLVDGMRADLHNNMRNACLHCSAEIICQLKAARGGIVYFNNLIRIADTAGSYL